MTPAGQPAITGTLRLRVHARAMIQPRPEPPDCQCELAEGATCDNFKIQHRALSVPPCLPAAKWPPACRRRQGQPRAAWPWPWAWLRHVPAMPSGMGRMAAWDDAAPGGDICSPADQLSRQRSAPTPKLSSTQRICRQACLSPRLGFWWPQRWYCPSRAERKPSAVRCAGRDAEKTDCLWQWRVAAG